MEYHTFDETWEAFGITTYEDYVKEFVLKDNFHNSVPKDVKESYKDVECIMAFAYYKYTMYDVALMKLTSIFELAIKKRCEEIGIPIHSNGNYKKSLDTLINELSNSENKQESRHLLMHTKKVRNHMMHPERYSFGLSIVNNIFKVICIAINKIFLDTNILKAFSSEVRVQNKKLKYFDGHPIVLEYEGYKFLIKEVRCIEAIKVNEDWLYLFFCETLAANITEIMKKNQILNAKIFCVKEVKFIENTLTATEIGTNKELKIYTSTNMEDIERYKFYTTEFEQLPKFNQYMFKMNFQSNKDKAKIDFYYSYLSKVISI